MSKLGRDFEESVYLFAKTLDPEAEVIFDHKVKDRDTGTSRQCDVWINAKFGGHWPLSLLVSCKDHGRKLDIGDIGTFCNEIYSSGASTGVIYSRNGFSKPALEKAKVNGIACCRLYQGESPDIPSSLWFNHFACYMSVKLILVSDVRNTNLKVWNDLFDIRSEKDGISILEYISNVFVAEGDKYVHIYKETLSKNPEALPEGWGTEVFFGLNDLAEKLRIQIWGYWRVYQAQKEATLLNGSYCLTDESYRGKMIGPPIDIKGSQPGDDWVEIKDKNFRLPKNTILTLLYHPSGVEDLFRSELGNTDLY